MANEMIDIDDSQQIGNCYDEFGNPIPCPEKPVADDTTPIDVKDQGEYEYANEVVDDYMSEAPEFFETFEADPTGEPIGATAPADEYKKQVVEPAPFFSSESWFGIKYLAGSVNPSKPGPTRVAKKNMNLLESNFEYISQYGKLADKEDYNYANTIFTALNKVPVINGKPVDLNNLEKLMQDPKMKEQILKFAGQYEKLPEVKSNWDLTWQLNMSHLKQEVLRDRYNDGNNIIYSDLKTTATILNAKFKAKKEWQPDFLELFNKDGKLITEKEYNTLLQNKTNASIAKWYAENPFPKNKPVYWQRVDFNPTAGHHIYNPDTKKYEQMDTRPKMQDSQEGWLISEDLMLQNATSLLNGHPSYKKMVASLSEEYNRADSKGVNRVRALFDSKDNPFNTPLGNTGGRVQAIPKIIKYDLGKGLLNDEKKARKEAIEFSNILDIASGKDKDKVLISIGGIEGKLPEETNSSLQTFIMDAVKEISNGKHTADYMPSGSIKFQNIATGDKNMHAYNITFDTDFLKRFKGTEDDKGPLFDIHATEEDWENLKNNGITIYVPKQLSEGTYIDNKGNEVPNSFFGSYSKRASETSAFEASFTRRNKINLTIPNCGSRTIIRNADNSISIVGYNLSLDPNTKKYEKLLIKQSNIPGASFFDLDDLIDRTLNDMKEIYDNNGEIHSSLLDQQNSK